MTAPAIPAAAVEAARKAYWDCAGMAKPEERWAAAISAALPSIVEAIAEAVEAMPIGSWGNRHDNERVQRDAAAIVRACGGTEG